MGIYKLPNNCFLCTITGYPTYRQARFVPHLKFHRGQMSRALLFIYLFIYLFIFSFYFVRFNSQWARNMSKNIYEHKELDCSAPIAKYKFFCSRRPIQLTQCILVACALHSFGSLCNGILVESTLFEDFVLVLSWIISMVVAMLSALVPQRSLNKAMTSKGL